MKISELIQMLEASKAKFGDTKIVIAPYAYGKSYPIEYLEIENEYFTHSSAINNEVRYRVNLSQNIQVRELKPKNN